MGVYALSRSPLDPTGVAMGPAVDAVNHSATVLVPSGPKGGNAVDATVPNDDAAVTHAAARARIGAVSMEDCTLAAFWRGKPSVAYSVTVH